MQLANSPQSLCDNCSASVEFHTLPIPPPVNLRLQKTANPDTYTLIWQPITQSNDTHQLISSGYSIYIDNILVCKIKDPNESTANLNSQLLNNAKCITIRTLSSDGMNESKDSQPVYINQNEHTTTNKQQSRIVDNNVKNTQNLNEQKQVCNL
jgi:hypothetical protein